jgi:CRISPR-associated protein Cse1 (CRISPR_cse1)
MVPAGWARISAAVWGIAGSGSVPHPLIRDALDTAAVAEPLVDTYWPVCAWAVAVRRAAGIGRTLFDHTTAAESPALSPAEAARWLITAQMYDTGGLKTLGASVTGFGSGGLAGRDHRGAVISVVCLLVRCLLGPQRAGFQRPGHRGPSRSCPTSSGTAATHLIRLVPGLGLVSRFELSPARSCSCRAARRTRCTIMSRP